MNYQTLLLFVSVLSIGVTSPHLTYALSCLDPASSIEYYIEDEQITIATAVAGETMEHITQPASTDGDPNRAYDAGYVGQRISVLEAHKGYIESEKWVYYNVNPTWGYMCTNQPPEAGVTSVYVLNNSVGAFDLPGVVQVYAVDSQYAESLLAAIKAGDITGSMRETSAESWTQDLAQTLREMVTILRIRLAEWRFWVAQ